MEMLISAWNRPAFFEHFRKKWPGIEEDKLHNRLAKYINTIDNSCIYLKSILDDIIEEASTSVGFEQPSLEERLTELDSRWASQASAESPSTLVRMMFPELVAVDELRQQF